MFVELTLPELSINFYSIKYQQSPMMLAQEKKREEKEKERKKRIRKEKEKRKKKKWIINYSMLGTCSATTTCAVNRDGKGPNVPLVVINTSYSRKKSILINITSK